MDYYYIVASLPSIELGHAPPVSKDEFLLQCQGVLSEEKLREVDAILNDRIEECASGYGCDLVSAETQLRNAIARMRASKRNMDARPFIREHSNFYGWVEKLAGDAFTRENPRERELALDHARWHIAEELAGVEPFSFGRVLAFAVKVRIAERWAQMDEEAGKQNVEQFIEAALAEPNNQ